MRTTALTDVDTLKKARKELEDLLNEIKSIENQGSVEQQRQTAKLKIKAIKKIEEIDHVLAALVERKPDENAIIKKMENARGKEYDQNALPLVKTHLQTMQSTIESYEEFKQDSLAGHVVDMLLFNLVRDAERYLLAMQPGYTPPESFFSYQDRVMKLAVTTVLDKNVHLVTAADPKKAKKDAAKVVAFFSNIGKNNDSESPSQPQPQRKPGTP